MKTSDSARSSTLTSDFKKMALEKAKAAKEKQVKESGVPSNSVDKTALITLLTSEPGKMFFTLSMDGENFLSISPVFTSLGPKAMDKATKDTSFNKKLVANLKTFVKEASQVTKIPESKINVGSIIFTVLSVLGKCKKFTKIMQFVDADTNAIVNVKGGWVFSVEEIDGDTVLLVTDPDNEAVYPRRKGDVAVPSNSTASDAGN